MVLVQWPALYRPTTENVTKITGCHPSLLAIRDGGRYKTGHCTTPKNTLLRRATCDNATFGFEKHLIATCDV